MNIKSHSMSKKKKNTFPIDELVHVRNCSGAEQIRTRKIFESLKQRAINKEFLSEHEKDFFYEGVVLSKLDDGKPEDYECCDNPKFKWIYLIYCDDVTGSSKYYDIKGKNVYRVQPPQLQDDLAYLYTKADEWEQIVLKENHSDQLLQQCCKETRLDLRSLDDEKNNAPFLMGSFLYQSKRRGIILRSKYLYLKALEIFEAIPTSELILRLNKEEIEINEYSIIHIASRHFAALSQQYESGKSYHDKIFLPWLLPSQLRNIFLLIDQCGFYKNGSIEKIAIEYDGHPYMIWTGIKTKYVKDIGKVNYRRLETFYPLTDTNELIKLHVDYTLHKLSEHLSLYVSNQ